MENSNQNNKVMKELDIGNDPRVKWIYENLYGEPKEFEVKVENNRIIIYGNVMIPGDFRGLPVKIDEVFGNVIVDNFENFKVGNIETLVNFPTIIHGNFDCRNNPKLTSLEHGPCEVYGHFICNGCGLTSIEHMPKYIKGCFYVSSNNIKDLSPILENKVENAVNADFNPCENTKLYRDLCVKNKMLTGLIL